MDICVFGDSIAWGAYDPKQGGWITLLRNHLEPRDIAVYNCGISGDDTDDLLKRFTVEATARVCGVVIFAIGINDSQYIDKPEDARVPREKFIANLNRLIEQAKEIASHVIFIGLTSVDEQKTHPISGSSGDVVYDNTNIRLYNSLIEEACQKHSLPFLDVFTLLEVSDLEDGLHPNTKGHEKLFRAVKDFLESQKLI